jgi:saccharopine dehydrogenase-like NADP-dependent oxidoreductase
MHNVLVLGGGKVGKAVAELFLGCGRGAYRVTLADCDDARLAVARANVERLRTFVRQSIDLATKRVDASKPAEVAAALKGHDALVCMLPYDLTRGLAGLANDAGVHYFDVTEDVKATEQVRTIADSGKARIALVPQCGLAPGYIAIAAHEIARDFAEIHELTLRVGALPQYPTNLLKYNVTWSTSGLINEYCEPCNAMLNGRLERVPALEGLERFSFEGVEYEAFYTSGGVGSLIDTLVASGRTSPATNIAYKTIRYQGHRDLMRFLLHDLRLGQERAEPSPGGRVFNRQTAMDLFDYALPHTMQDVAVIFINCIGIRRGRREQQNFQRSIRAMDLFGRTWPAIELTTAAGVCAMVDLHRTGRLPKTGLIRQEQCSLKDFNSTPFGAAFEDPKALESAARG